jgi:hypothetical protein
MDMVITLDGFMLRHCEGDPPFHALVGAIEDLIESLPGVAPVAELDGDEVGYLVERVAEINRQR